MKKNISLLLAIIMLISAFPVFTYAEEFNTGAHQAFIDFENGTSNISANGTVTSGGTFVDRSVDSTALSDANGSYVYSLPVTSTTSTKSGGYIDFETVFGAGNVFNPGERLIIECDYYNHGTASVNGFGFSFPQTNTDGSVKTADMRRPLLWWTKEYEGKRYFVCKGSNWDTTAGLDTEEGWYTIKTEIYYASDASDKSWEIISFKKQGEASYTSIPKVMLDGTNDDYNNKLDYSKEKQKYLSIFGTSAGVKNYIDNLKITLIEKELFESIQSATNKNDIKSIIADFSLIEGFEYLSGYSSLHSAYKNYIAENLFINKSSLVTNELVKTAYLDYADDEIDISGSYTLEIKGSTKVLKPMDSSTAAITCKVYDNDSNEISDITWSCTGAEVLADGTLLINKNTPAGLTLHATDSMGVSCEKTISVTDGFFENFENKTPGTKLDTANNYGEIIEGDTKYAKFPVVDTGNGSYDIGISLGTVDGISDNLNISFDFKADAAGSYRFPAFLGKDASNTNQWINESKYTVAESGDDYVYTFKIQSFADGATSSEITKNLTVPKDEWINAEFIINPDTQRFDLTLSAGSASASAENLGFKALDSFNISAVRFRANASYARGIYDNVAFYTGDKFSRTLGFTGSDIMTVSSDGGKKLLVAQLTDNGIQNDAHSVKWQLCSVSNDFSGSISDVRILGANTLVVDTACSGSVFVEGILDDNVTSTGIVEIKLTGAFSSAADNGAILVNGTSGDTYTVNVFKPVNSDFISACLAYDINSCENTSLTIQSNGSGAVNISSLMDTDGMYMIEIINNNNPLECNVFEVYKNTDILPQTNREALFGQNNISAYLLNFTNAESEVINEAISLYNLLSSDAKSSALRFSGNNINDIYTSIYLASVLDGNSSQGDKCRDSLNAMSLSGDAIPVLIANSEYNRIGSQIIADSLISTALLTEDYLLEYTLSHAMNVLTDELVITGVRQSGSYPTGVSKYIGLLGNSYYDNGDDLLKGAIHSAVAGNTYANISLLNTAINNVPQPVVMPQGGGGTGKPVVNTSGTPSAPVTDSPVGISFNDVNNSHWAYSFISYLANKGIVTGYNGCYYPENSITRAEYAKLIYSAFNIPDTQKSFFNDVTEELWCFDAVNALAAYGIITGYNGNFEPDTPITRQDAAVIAARALEKTGFSLPKGEAAFSDNDKISEYAKSQVSSLTMLQVLTGTPEGTYEPLRNITKAESSAVICRILNMLAGGAN